MQLISFTSNISYSLLSDVARHTKTTTLDLYKRYLSLTLGTNCSTSLLEILNEKYIQEFLSFNRAPKYFYVRNYHDISKLQDITERPIVILHAKSKEMYLMGKGIKKVFDTRLTHFLANTIQCQTESDVSNCPLTYLLTENVKELYYLENANIPYNSIVSESKFVCQSFKFSSHEDRCYLKALSLVIDDACVLKGHDCKNQNDKLFCTDNFLTLCLNKNECFSKALNLTRPIALVGHVSTDVWKPRGQELFLTLGVLKTCNNDKIVWSECLYVALTPDRQWLYKVKQAQASKILASQETCLKNFKLKREHKNNLLIQPELDEDSVTSFLTGASATAAHHNPSSSLIKCNCKYCQRAKTYTKKQLGYGPQKLYKNPLTLFDFLKLFNLDNDANRQLILQSCSYSMATLDFECYSQESSNHPLLNVPRDIVTDTKLGSSGVPLVSQKPVLFCHLDSLVTDTTTNTSFGAYHYKVFHVPSDLSYTMALASYLDHLFDRKEKLRLKKIELLEPFLTFISIAKKAHFNFFLEMGTPRKQIALSFKAGIFGQFETALFKLINTLKVYTFNGINYDHILLGRNLVAALQQVSYNRAAAVIHNQMCGNDDSYFYNDHNANDGFSPVQQRLVVVRSKSLQQSNKDTESKQEEDASITTTSSSSCLFKRSSSSSSSNDIIEDTRESTASFSSLVTKSTADDSSSSSSSSSSVLVDDSSDTTTTTSTTNSSSTFNNGKDIEEDKENFNNNRLSPPSIRVKLSREGSSINNIILVEPKIGFYDIKKFLPPNATLATLAKMTNCEQSKGAFPFEQLKSYDYLVKTQELPSDPLAWGSRLSDKAPTADEVRQYIKDFKDEGHPNLLSYLTKYLILDVLLLMKSSVKLFTSFYKLADSHPIVSNKNSLSSFSASSLQAYLMRNKSPGLFIPNHPQIYSVIKGSLLGGVSLVTRTDGGTMPGDEPINAHLGFKEKARKIIAADENTLYGSSGKYYYYSHSKVRQLFLFIFFLLVAIVLLYLYLIIYY